MGAVAVLVFSVLATYGAIAAIALGAVDVGSVLRLPEAAINKVVSVGFEAQPSGGDYNAPPVGSNSRSGGQPTPTIPIVQATPVTPGSAFENSGGLDDTTPPEVESCSLTTDKVRVCC